MRPISLIIAVLALLGGCGDRTLAEEEEVPLPDIEGLCQTFCDRTLECGSAPDITKDECVDNCMGVGEWDIPQCVEPREALYMCINQYECPDFTNHIICDDDELTDHACCPEANANALCAF